MTDFRTLCAELHTALEKHDLSLAEYRLFGPSAAALRAALAEPEPEGPTDEELSDLWSWSAGQDQGPWPTQQHCFARAVLARWGNHPGSPDSSTLQPVPVSERLPGPGDCDAEGRCWWWYPEVPDKTYGYWAYEDDAVPERALNEQPTHWLPAHALPLPS